MTTTSSGDATDYQEWITWREIVPSERIALLHGESHDDPNAFESVLTFERAGEQTLRHLAPYVIEIVRKGVAD